MIVGLHMTKIKWMMALCSALVFAFCTYVSPEDNASSASYKSKDPANKTNNCSLPQGAGDPVATVAGQPIYQQDLCIELGPKLRELRQQEYQMESQALDELIRKRLF